MFAKMTLKTPNQIPHFHNKLPTERLYLTGCDGGPIKTTKSGVKFFIDVKSKTVKPSDSQDEEEKH